MLKPKNITLERVKQSKYWNLIGIMIWNHYSEARYQDESMIEITEQWYGQGKEDSSSHSKYWNNPDYTEKDYVRTLGHIHITLKREDYESLIHINVRDGNVGIIGFYVDKEKTKQPYYYYGTTDVTNWMLENDLLEEENIDEDFSYDA